MKPLYILNESVPRISTQGSALRIECEQQAPAVMAIRYISQVVAPATARWTPRALSLCMRSGVPIVFVSDHGHVLGFLHGTGSHQRSGLFDRLRELLAQPNGRRIYSVWWKSMESRQRCRLAGQLRIPPDRHRCRSLRRAMERARHARASTTLVRVVEQTWKRGLSGLVAELLPDQGLDATRRRALWPQLDPTSDLITLLEWSLFLPSLQELKRVQAAVDRGDPPPMIRATILARFQCLVPDLRTRATDVLHRLDQRLLEEGIV